MTCMTSLALPFEKELVVDLFAGGGGASSGIAEAYREPDVAVNHNPIALAVHRANHPNTEHYVADVFEVDPICATKGQPVGILWASPDCRHHSKAKGAKPRNRKIRGLAWVIIRWAYQTSPRLIFLENVEEFADWGPLDDEGRPIKAEKGRTFQAFVNVLNNGIPEDHPDLPEILAEIGDHVPKEALVRGLRYNFEHQVRVAADQGAPTIRKRLYGIARRDGKPIVWPAPTHHKNPSKGQKAWRSAAECIDWELQGRTIFRDDALVENTMNRIAKGLWRHTLASDDHSSSRYAAPRSRTPARTAWTIQFRPSAAAARITPWFSRQWPWPAASRSTPTDRRSEPSTPKSRSGHRLPKSKAGTSR